MADLSRLETVRQPRLVVFPLKVAGYFAKLVVDVVTPAPFLGDGRKLMGNGFPCLL